MLRSSVKGKKRLHYLHVKSLCKDFCSDLRVHSGRQSVQLHYSCKLQLYITCPISLQISGEVEQYSCTVQSSCTVQHRQSERKKRTICIFSVVECALVTVHCSALCLSTIHCPDKYESKAYYVQHICSAIMFSVQYQKCTVYML